VGFECERFRRRTYGNACARAESRRQLQLSQTTQNSRWLDPLPTFDIVAPRTGNELRYRNTPSGRALTDTSVRCSPNHVAVSCLADGDRLVIANLPTRFQRAWGLKRSAVCAVFRMRDGADFFEVIEGPTIPARQMSGKATFIVTYVVPRTSAQPMTQSRVSSDAWPDVVEESAFASRPASPEAMYVGI
jgi:hypothetical protein